jgi:hypothetical protein
MTSRSIAPWTVTAGLLILTVSAAVISVVTAPRVQDVAIGTPAEKLQMAARQTMTSSSFTRTIQVGRADQMKLEYQAPDRSLDDRGGIPVIFIGNTFYYIGRASPREWVEQPTVKGELTGVADAMELVSLLLSAQKVRQDGNIFSFGWVSLTRSFEVSGTATVENGLVVAENLAERYGDLHQTARVYYSRFGTSPPVTLPPAKEIVHATKCHGSYIRPDVPCEKG